MEGSLKFLYTYTEEERILRLQNVIATSYFQIQVLTKYQNFSSFGKAIQKYAKKSNLYKQYGHQSFPLDIS